MSSIIFREAQRVRQWWIWSIVFLLFGGYGFLLLERYYISSPFEPHEISNMQVLALGAVPLLIFFLAFSVKLVVEICDDGVYYRLYPFMLHYRFVSWDEIERMYIREYSPIKEYGGWGIRFGFSQGKAYTVSGNWGLQLELKSGKRILLGTHKRASLENAIIAIKERTGISSIEMYHKPGT